MKRERTMKPRVLSVHAVGGLLLLACFTGPLAAAATPPAEGLRLAVFDVDVTPPVGSMMAYDPVKAQGELSLRGRGVILLGAGEPIVLCAVDWIGISNEGHDVFQQRLAEAAGTTPQRVAVHTVHQHDAPDCDFGTERLLREHGLPLGPYEGTFARAALERLTAAVRVALGESKPVTHLGFGQAQVREVASNRRILGPDGKVRATRWTATPDPALRAEPEGTIDPFVSLVSFWNGDQPLAVLSYYACHPQSYYRTGVANPDFPGIARFLRQQQVPDALHIHFNGAGGNLGAGKYNDGSHTNRWVLAQRLADGMKRAWEATERSAAGREGRRLEGRARGTASGGASERGPARSRPARIEQEPPVRCGGGTGLAAALPGRAPHGAVLPAPGPSPPAPLAGRTVRRIPTCR